MKKMAVYLGETGSDDGIVTCGIIPEPEHGLQFPVMQVFRCYITWGNAKESVMNCKVDVNIGFVLPGAK